MPDLPDLRSALGHAVADAMQEELARIRDELRATREDPEAIDPRLVASAVWPRLLRSLEVQRALVRWCREDSCVT